MTEAADPASAQAAAKSSGHRVEISSRRDADEQTFANADGTFTTETTAEPVRAQKADGSWAPIDTGLVKDGKGVHPGLALGSVAFSPGGATAPLASLSDGSGSLQVSWPGVLPAPTLAGDTATYASVQPNTDLIVRATRRGYEDSVVLRTAPTLSQQSFRFGLKTSGWVASANDRGMVTLTSAAGAKAAVMAPSRMFDAHRDPLSGEPDRFGAVTTQLVTAKDGSQQLVLTPDPKFLADPTTTYPVAIDPDVHLGEANDMWVASNSTGGSGSSELRVGYYSGNAATHRSFVKFSQAPISAKHVISATLSLYQWYTPTGCTAKNSRIYALSAGFDDSTTWTTQPGAGPTLYAQSNAVYGATGCTSWWNTYDVTSLAAGWAGGTIANYGLLVRSGTESDTSAWWRFYGQTNGTNVPTLAVSYNSYPTVGVRSTVPSTPCATGSGRPFENNVRPRLNGIFSDADGGTVKGSFEVWPQGGSSAFNSGTSLTWTPPGTVNGWTMTSSLTNNSSYQWRVRGWDGTDYSTAWSSWCEFTVDNVAPGAPTISSTGYPANTWTSGGAAATFALSATDSGSGVDHYLWGLDNSANVTTPLEHNATSLTIPTPADGWHNLYVRAVDGAGNLGPVSSGYSFGTVPGVTSPAAGAVTGQSLSLSATAPTSSTLVSFYWRRTATDPWSPMPAGNITPAAGSPAFAAWPYSVSLGSNGAKTPALIWDAAGTSGATDGPLQIGVCFGASTTCTATPGTALPSGSSNSQPVNATLDRKEFNVAETSSIGPAAVNLLTGNAQLAASDVSVPGSSDTVLSISRTLNTATASTTSGIFGPGWTAALPVDGVAADWTGLSDTGSLLTLNGPDQTTIGFAKNLSGTAWLPTGPDLDSGYTLTATSSACATNYRCFMLTDLDNVQVLLQSQAASPPASGTALSPVLFDVVKVTEPGNSAATSFITTTLPGGGPVVTSRVLSPVPAAGTCTDPASSNTWTPGCRALDLSYGSAGGALNKLVAATYDTNVGSGVVQVDVGCWGYDSAGRLSDQWDPRDIPTAASSGKKISCDPLSPVRPIHYSYDSSGIPTTVTPAYSNSSAPVAGSTLAFTSGKLTSITRTHLAGYSAGTETTNVVYNVPVAPDSGHVEYRPDLTASTVLGWNQFDIPDPAVGATAVCPPGSSPSNPTATGDLRDCLLTYLDVNGRAVNTATYSGTGAAGWHIGTTEYDELGHTIRTLDAANREEALSPTTGAGALLGLPSSTAVGAMELSTISIYTPNPNDNSVPDLTDTFGPMHSVIIPGSTSAGTSTVARAHTHLTYDTGTETGHPAGGSLHLTMTSVTGASQGPDAIAVNETDQRTTQNVYTVGTDPSGWIYGSPLETITDPSGLNIVKQTVLDANTGRVLETRMPTDVASASPGGTAGTTKSVYYSASAISGADSDCGGLPGQDGLLCKTYPADLSPSGGAPGLISTKYSYDYLNRTTSTIETPTGDITHARTTTTIFGFNSTIASGVSTNPYANTAQQTIGTGGVGTALPSITTSFDSATGRVTSTSDGTTADSSSYDDFGRLTTYSENTGSSGAQINIVTSDYDPTTGRMTGTRDSHQRITTTYNSSTEHRGLPTHVGVEVTASNNSSPALWSGSFDASYNPNGVVTTQTDSNNVLSTLSRDETGQLLSRIDTQAGAAWLSDTATASVSGQWTSHAGMASQQTYTYDSAGRLVKAADTALSTGLGCTTRSYSFDRNSNRLAGNRFDPDINGACVSTGTPTATVSHSYDAADRLIDSGVAYDSFGRTSSLPAADTNNPTGAAMSLGYYSNDLVRSQTQGSNSQCWTLDPNQRLRESLSYAASSCTGIAIADTVNHYDASSGDSPDWIAENAAASNWTANIGDMLGSLAAIVDQTGTVTYQYANLHGDIQAISANGASLPTIRTAYDEFGSPTDATARRYGWLGAKQRSGDAIGGVLVMGVRLYVPVLGRFLQTDPVPGGSCNGFDYVCQDPVNATDLGGQTMCEGGACGGGNRTVGGSVGWSNEQIAFEYFVHKGLKPTYAAAIVGNLIVESPGVNPRRHQKGGPAQGIAQWEAKRWAGLQRFANGRKASPFSLRVQLDYIWFELHHGFYYRHAFLPLLATKNLADATNAVMRLYEQAGDVGSLGRRFDAARRVLLAYGGSSGRSFQ